MVFVASLIGIVHGGPVGETTNPHIQSIHLRLEVLNQVASNMVCITKRKPNQAIIDN